MGKPDFSSSKTWSQKCRNFTAAELSRKGDIVSISTKCSRIWSQKKRNEGHNKTSVLRTPQTWYNWVALTLGEESAYFKIFICLIRLASLYFQDMEGVSKFTPSTVPEV